jgi:tetratricopeptide (TPR) repeat protein
MPHGGRVLWSDTYERSAAQVLALQADVVRGLAAAVRLTVRPGAADRLSAVRAVNPEAYQEYLKGRYEWNQRTPESLDRALAYFVQARQLDPTYAPAYAALADVYSQHATVLVGTGSPLEYRPLATDAAIRALQIDPFSAEAHAALGYVRHYDLRWDEAEASFLRAMELNPNYPMAHLWYANLLMSLGRMDEALDHADMARALEPYSLIVNANIGWILAAAGRAAEAVVHLDRTLELDSTYVQARFRRMAALHALGRVREALEEGERLSA